MTFSTAEKQKKKQFLLISKTIIFPKQPLYFSLPKTNVAMVMIS